MRDYDYHLLLFVSNLLNYIVLLILFVVIQLILRFCQNVMVYYFIISLSEPFPSFNFRPVHFNFSCMVVLNYQVYLAVQVVLEKDFLLH